MARFYPLPTGVFGAGDTKNFGDAEQIAAHDASLKYQNQAEGKKAYAELMKAYATLPSSDVARQKSIMGAADVLFGKNMSENDLGEKFWAPNPYQAPHYTPLAQKRFNTSNALNNYYKSPDYQSLSARIAANPTEGSAYLKSLPNVIQSAYGIGKLRQSLQAEQMKFQGMSPQELASNPDYQKFLDKQSILSNAESDLMGYGMEDLQPLFENFLPNQNNLNQWQNYRNVPYYGNPNTVPPLPPLK